MFKKVTLIAALMSVMVFLSGCANTSLFVLKKKQQEHYTGMIKAYEEALNACKKDMIGMTNQMIDEQMRNYLLINVLAKETGKDPSEVMDAPLLSYSEMKAYYERFHVARTEKVDGINTDFEKWYEQVDAELAKAESLKEAIVAVEKQRLENWKQIGRSAASAAATIGMFAILE